MANRLSSIDRPTVFAPSLRLLAKMGNILAAIEGRYGPPNWKAARSMILDDDVQRHDRPCCALALDLRIGHGNPKRIPASRKHRYTGGG